MIIHVEKMFQTMRTEENSQIQPMEAVKTMHNLALLKALLSRRIFLYVVVLQLIEGLTSNVVLQKIMVIGKIIDWFWVSIFFKVV